MAHSIRYTRNAASILTDSEISDLIEMFYRWEDAKFHIVIEHKHKRWRGSAEWKSFEREHEVTFYVDNIKKDFLKKGIVGGSQPAPSEKAAMAMVLAHEIQHCNQVKMHKQDARSSFYGGHQYWNLASEREARGFVDEKLNEICAYFGLPPQMRTAQSKLETDVTPELEDVVKLLVECDEVSPEDINDELRASGILKPGNVAFVRKELQALGIEIKKKEKVYFRS